MHKTDHPVNFAHRHAHRRGRSRSSSFYGNADDDEEVGLDASNCSDEMSQAAFDDMMSSHRGECQFTLELWATCAQLASESKTLSPRK